MGDKPIAHHFSDLLQLDRRLIFLDVAILLVAVLLIITPVKIVFFHLVFFGLTFGAFFWKFQAFAVRAFFWVTVTTVAVFLAILAGEIPIAEITEIPLLTIILILVFFIAQQRAKAQEALRETNEKLEYRVATRTAELTAVNAQLTREIKEHQQAEQALRESEERYRRLVELSFEAITIHSQGRLVSINSHGARLFGATTPEELIGKSVLEFVHPDYMEIVQARVQQISQEGRDAPLVEEKLIRLDGSNVYVEVAAVPITYYGRPAVQTVVRDITERKQAEVEREKLLTIEREQRVLAETLGEVFLALTAQTSYETVLDEILHQVKRIISYRAANIALIIENTLRIARHQGYEVSPTGKTISDMIQPLTTFPLDAEVVFAQQPLIVTDTRQTSGWVTLPETTWIRSSIAVPICLRDSVLGLLRLDSDVPASFSAHDADRLLPLANAAAIALENARLHDQARQKIAERIQAEKALRRIAAKNQAILDVIPDSFLQLNHQGQLLEYKAYEANIQEGFLDALEIGKSVNDMLPADLARLIMYFTAKALATHTTQMFEYQLSFPQDIRDFEIRLVVSGPDEVLAIMRDITERKIQEEALERERARIAQVLHDSLGQNLGYLHLKLDEFATKSTMSWGEDFQQQLSQMRDAADEAYELVRSMLAATRPANSTDLATALLALARSTGNRARFKVQLTSDGQTHPLSPIVQHQVLYLFQEALSNVEKHANARQVSLNLSWREKSLTITLLDDGLGFETSAPLSDDHFGLQIMQERAEEINGFLTIDSRPQLGTKLTLRLPLSHVIEDSPFRA
jgi:PAS domain S-box-containing protein